MTKIGWMLLMTGAGGSFAPSGVVVAIGVSTMLVAAVLLAIALESALDAAPGPAVDAAAGPVLSPAPPDVIVGGRAA